MAFSQRMVLKSATTMSLHERFSQLRQTLPSPVREHTRNPGYDAPVPTYTPPAARAKTAPPAPPRIYDDYDDDDVGKFQLKNFQSEILDFIHFHIKFLDFRRNC